MPPQPQVTAGMEAAQQNERTGHSEHCRVPALGPGGRGQGTRFSVRALAVVLICASAGPAAARRSYPDRLSDVSASQGVFANLNGSVPVIQVPRVTYFGTGRESDTFPESLPWRAVSGSRNQGFLTASGE